MSFYKIQYRLVPLGTLIWRIPATHPCRHQNKPLLWPETNYCHRQKKKKKKKNFFIHTLTLQMIEPPSPFSSAPQYWGTKKPTLFCHLHFRLDHFAGLAEPPAHPPRPSRHTHTHTSPECCRLSFSPASLGSSSGLPAGLSILSSQNTSLGYTQVSCVAFMPTFHL